MTVWSYTDVSLRTAAELRTEIKHLREANKALTLYVSKIVDRVCSQEGFEKVLSVEFKSSSTHVETSAPSHSVSHSDSNSDTPRARPASSFFRAPTASSTSSNSLGRESSAMSSPPPVVKNDRSRKTLSLGWDSVSSAFASALSRTGPISPAPVAPSGFKPFMLNANSDLARRFEMEEDAEDARERERLKAEMALHGITEYGRSSSTEGTRGGGLLEPPATKSVGMGLLSSPVLAIPSSSSGHGSRTTSNSSNTSAPFRRSLLLSSPSQSDRDDDSTISLKVPLANSNSLALQFLDTGEKEAKSELEKGRASGFTESKPRRQRPLSTQSIRSNGIGLGIGSPDLSPRIGAVSPALSAGGFEGASEEGDAGWSKKLKRMSLGWSSPTVV